MIHKFGLLAFVLLALEACSSDSSAGSGDPSGEEQLPAGSRAELTRAIDEVVAEKVAPGVSITVAHPNYAAWSASSGIANVETRAPMVAASRFRAGSMLKIAVATAILQLVEQNDIGLDDTLPMLLPREMAERISDSYAITLRMLLNHTSGLAEFSDEAFDALVFENPKRVWSFDELLNRALSLPASKPGGPHAYTNTGYILLGKILEQRLGQPWRAVVRERVFARAKLVNSELPEEGNALCTGCARGYESIAGALLDFTEIDPSMAGAAGGDALITTPADLARLLEAIFAGKLFDRPATLGLMLEFVAAPIPEEAQTSYSLGLSHHHLFGKDFIGHLGGTAGFQGFVLHEPLSGLTVSGSMNQRGDLGAFILPVLEAAARVE